ncbi:MAG: Type secretion basal body protein YscI, HrpB, PscI [Pseudomonadota bacterium]
MAIEPLLTGIASGAVTVAPHDSSPVSGATTALAIDVERFQAALSTPSPGDPPRIGPGLAFAEANAASPRSATSLELATGAGQPPTLGAAILASLQSASADVSKTWQHAATTLASPDLTIGQALEMQMLLLKTTIEFDLSGKLITKAAQNLEQIVKTQ